MSSNAGGQALLLKNAHVIDPSQGIDRVTDVLIADGKIGAVGQVPPDPQTPVLDLSGSYLTPGWIDLHVHAYGTLGFSDPDSIGVYHGVTSFVEAGGPGIDTLDEFIAVMDRLETDLYVGPFIRPMGLLGLNFIEGDVRTLGNVPIARWLDFAKEHRNRLRYLKCNAIGDYGTGTLKITKGLSEILASIRPGADVEPAQVRRPGAHHRPRHPPPRQPLVIVQVEARPPRQISQGVGERHGRHVIGGRLGMSRRRQDEHRGEDAEQEADNPAAKSNPHQARP